MDSIMIYYLKSGGISTTKQAHSHKQAAMRLLHENESEIGRYIIVDKKKIEESNNMTQEESNNTTQMFFSTQALIDERNCTTMKLVD